GGPTGNERTSIGGRRGRAGCATTGRPPSCSWPNAEAGHDSRWAIVALPPPPRRSDSQWRNFPRCARSAPGCRSATIASTATTFNAFTTAANIRCRGAPRIDRRHRWFDVEAALAYIAAATSFRSALLRSRFQGAQLAPQNSDDRTRDARVIGFARAYNARRP